MNCSIDARRVKTDLITFANIYIRKSDGKKTSKSLALIRKYGPFCSIDSYMIDMMNDIEFRSKYFHAK